MIEVQSTLAPAISFVEGRLSPLEFEAALSSNPDLEAALSKPISIPPYTNLASTLFHYLIALSYTRAGDILNAQDAVVQFLKRHSVSVTPAQQPASLHDLLLAAQPRWLSADPSYIATLLEDAPNIPPAQLKRWLKVRILERFRFISKPPRWLQSPAWPIGPNGPLVFVGQLSISDYFHDKAEVFVFHDPTAVTCSTIIQVA